MDTREADSKPSLSVVMAVWNPDSAFFPIAVRSILDQTFTDFELIIVEDPSPRNGLQILAGLKDDRIRYVSNDERVGLIAQRNQGLAAARADLVAILDADDIAEPSRLRKQMDFLIEHTEIDVLGSQISVIDERGTPRGFRRFPESPDEILAAMPYFVPLSHPSVMYRRNTILFNGGYRNFVHQHVDDYELWSRLATKGIKFANMNEALVQYRIHSEMGKVRKLREVIRGVVRVKQIYWSDTMDLKARIRMWGERCLLFLPSSLVIRLMMVLLYREKGDRQKQSDVHDNLASRRQAEMESQGCGT